MAALSMRGQRVNGESMRLMKTATLPVSAHTRHPSHSKATRCPKRPPGTGVPPWAGGRGNRDCTVRRGLLVGFFTFDVIVVNRSGCVRWGSQTWARGGEGGSGARQCPS